jgi:hypothetical protein
VASSGTFVIYFNLFKKFTGHKDQLPLGATTIGTILSSDKTNISIMTGDRNAHPLLLTIANISMDVRMKASSHAFMLVALLPCSKFLVGDKKIRGVLEKCLLHKYLDIVTHPLKLAARFGIMLPDCWGNMRFCFTPLVSYIADTPEATMLSGVTGKTSHLTTATYKQFSDPFHHELRTGSTTLSQIMAAESKTNPWDIQSFLREVKHFRLNGVHRPFWRDWAMSCPSKFLTIEILHHIHKLFFDHDLKWCWHVLGAEKLDFQFSVIQPRVRFRHFPGGVSKLKQATGWEHHEMQRSIVAVMAGARKEIVLCIWALIDFRYLTQSPRLDEDDLVKMNATLQLFHSNKFAITESGARCSKKSSSDWYIPKLELMQSTVANARQSGAPIQFTADVTEKLHSVNIKMPVRGQSNNHGYDAQICHHLNHMEKSYNFDLATLIHDGGIDLDNVLSSALPDDDDVDDEPSDGFPPTHSQQKLPAARSKRPLQDLFLKATEILSSILYPNIFATSSIAFSLNHAPHMNKSTIDDVAKLFNIPDFKITLADYLDRIHRVKIPTNLLKAIVVLLTFKAFHSLICGSGTMLGYS